MEKDFFRPLFAAELFAVWEDEALAAAVVGRPPLHWLLLYCYRLNCRSYLSNLAD